MSNGEVIFDFFIKPEKWCDLETHMKSYDEQIEKDLVQLSSENKRLQKEARKYLESEFEIKKVSEGKLKWAEGILFGGDVCGIDGTYSTYPMQSGIRCRIGVAATTYRNKRTEGIVFVSEQQVKTEETDVIEILKSRKKENKLISGLLIRAIMFYMERYKALERPEKWLWFNGPLVPYELRTGIGKMRALDTCLKICEKIINRKTVTGIIAKSTHDELVSLGLALNPCEYVRLRSFKEDLLDYLEEAHFNTQDYERMKEFIENFGCQVDVGLYRGMSRSYIFHAHKEFFDDAASLVIKDSLFQTLRSYPMLIDYADSLCTRLLASSDFQRIIDHKLAKLGHLPFELSEMSLRRR